MKVYKIWCQWNIGQDTVLFESVPDAISWAKEALSDRYIKESFEMLEEYDFIGIDSINVIMRSYKG